MVGALNDFTGLGVRAPREGTWRAWLVYRWAWRRGTKRHVTLETDSLGKEGQSQALNLQGAGKLRSPREASVTFQKVGAVGLRRAW